MYIISRQNEFKRERNDAANEKVLHRIFGIFLVRNISIRAGAELNATRSNSEREYKKETEICIIRYCAECKREFPWQETQRGKVYPKAREPSYENKNQDVRGRIDGKNRE